MTRKSLRDNFRIAYIGTSPDTGKPLFAERRDRKLKFFFNDAVKTAEVLGRGLRLPSEKELLMIVESKKLKASFDQNMEYLTSDKDGQEISVVKPGVAHSYRRPTANRYKVRFVCN